MKTLILALASLAFAIALSTATYNGTLKGSQTAAESGKIVLNLNASGDLPGMIKLHVERDGQNVVGGTWRMTVLPQNADAASSERGQLVGTITGGSLALNSEGTIASVNSVTVVFQGGTGEFDSVTTGNATMNVSADTENPSQLSGSIVLNF
ncbi:MAG TPA: hypothetical protein VFR78_08955 [Pyrinomonadaceae bacterium]|nr:hypothetical protein [Pyrinomonadaceae bacterium]